MAGRGGARKKTAAKGYQLPEPIPEGYEISDTTKKSWLIGTQIGSGGFGTVYFASSKEKPKEMNYVIKIEYHANGPLFAEMHCYQNIGKPARIEEWIKQKKLPYLGLSPCHGFGSFEYKGSKYRFMVLEKFGKDLQKLLEENNRKFPPETVYNIALSVINVLEYIHSNGYIHGDVKPANLLLGPNKKTENQVYLVDMGLACKYMRDGSHKKEEPDPKKAHNGTPEFTSRDAHRGCFSRRSDLELLCYNMLQWLCGELPWECHKANNVKLQQEKEKFMKHIDDSLDELFEDEDCPVVIRKLLSYVGELKFEDEPSYELCRKVLKEELKKLGCEKSSVLNFKSPAKKTKVPAAKKVKTVSDKENTKGAKAKQEKRKCETPPVLDPGIIPTPAMLEILQKRSLAKEAKTRKKK
ncbi:serine/threonine-protein kinase VRK1 isoform X2 [Parasteatoda tepidariorum]|uniref:serine/threonine-protein kinase VRK1 isoform X1 n=1 Tax=Parasteatoda tepidariorum TaxID=114398 RepID=UPI001C71B52F|nr:serine/threonine-protein kinase VRK1 isoform X1 [Parasteatoda tepidariorum]XP_042902558.1 serine/threonine-protein kinase VRK1 isoform X2 [Parasteatoda tepidariorum]